MMEFISEETFERALFGTNEPQKSSPFRAIELHSATETSLTFSWDFVFDDGANKKAEFDHYECSARDEYGHVKSRAESPEPRCTLGKLSPDTRYVVRISAVFRGGGHVVAAPEPIEVPSITTYATSFMDDFCVAMAARGSGVSHELLAASEESQALFTCAVEPDFDDLSAHLTDLKARWRKEVDAALGELGAVLGVLRAEEVDPALRTAAEETGLWAARVRGAKYDFRTLTIGEVRARTRALEAKCNEHAKRALKRVDEMLDEFGVDLAGDAAPGSDPFDRDEQGFRRESVFYEACREVRAWADDVRGDPALLTFQGAVARHRALAALWERESAHAFGELEAALDEMSGDAAIAGDIAECREWLRRAREVAAAANNRENAHREKDEGEGEAEEEHKKAQHIQANRLNKGNLISTALAKKASLRRLWDAHTAAFRVKRAERRPSRQALVSSQDLSLLGDGPAAARAEAAWTEEVAALERLVRGAEDPLSAALGPVVEEMARAEASCPGSAVFAPAELTAALLRAQRCVRGDAVAALRAEARLLSTAEASEAMRAHCAAATKVFGRGDAAAAGEWSAELAAEALKRRGALRGKWAAPRARGPPTAAATPEDEAVVLATYAGMERRQAAAERVKGQRLTLALLELERCLAEHEGEDAIAGVRERAAAVLERAHTERGATEQELWEARAAVADAWDKEINAALLALETTVSRHIACKCPATERMCAETLAWIEAAKARMDPCAITVAAIRARREEIARCWRVETTRTLLALKHAAQSNIFDETARAKLAQHVAWADSQIAAMGAAKGPAVDIVRAVDARSEIVDAWRAAVDAALARLEATLREYRAVPGNPLTARKCADVEAEIAEIRAEPYPGHATAGDVRAMGDEVRCVWLRERRAALSSLEAAVRNYGECAVCAEPVERGRALLEAAAAVPDEEAAVGDPDGPTAEGVAELVASIEDAWKTAVMGELEEFGKLSAGRWPEAHAWIEAHFSKTLFDPRMVTPEMVSKKRARLEEIATHVARDRLSDLDMALARVAANPKVCAAQSVCDAKALSETLHKKLDKNENNENIKENERKVDEDNSNKPNDSNDSNDPITSADMGAMDAAIRATEDTWVDIGARTDLRYTMERLSLCGPNLPKTAAACASVGRWLRSQEALADLGSGNGSVETSAEARKIRAELVAAWRSDVRECAWDARVPEDSPSVAVDGRTLVRTGSMQIFGAGYAKVLGDLPASPTRISRWVFRRPSAQSDASSGSKVLVGLIPTVLVADRHDDDDAWKKRGWFVLLKDLTKIHKKTVEKYGHDFVAPGDTITMRLDPVAGLLSFALNGVTIGTAFDCVAPDVPLYPAVMLPDKGDAIELLSSATYSSGALDLGTGYPQQGSNLNILAQQKGGHGDEDNDDAAENSNSGGAQQGSSSQEGRGGSLPAGGCGVGYSSEPTVFAKPSGYEQFSLDSSTPLPRGRKTRWAVYVKASSSAKVHVGVKRVAGGNGDGGAVYLDCSTSSVVGLPASQSVTYKTRVKGGDLVSVEADTGSGLLTFFVNYKPLLPPVRFMSERDAGAGNVAFKKSTVLFKTGDIVEIYYYDNVL